MQALRAGAYNGRDVKEAGGGAKQEKKKQTKNFQQAPTALTTNPKLVALLFAHWPKIERVSRLGYTHSQLAVKWLEWVKWQTR